MIGTSPLETPPDATSCVGTGRPWRRWSDSSALPPRRHVLRLVLAGAVLLGGTNSGTAQAPIRHQDIAPPPEFARDILAMPQRMWMLYLQVAVARDPRFSATGDSAAGLGLASRIGPDLLHVLRPVYGADPAAPLAILVSNIFTATTRPLPSDEMLMDAASRAASALGPDFELRPEIFVRREDAVGLNLVIVRRR